MSRSNGSAAFRLTLIHPSVGRRAGDSYYVRTWQMEPLPPAMIAALTPEDVDVRFYDDRLEPIPFDEPTDLVALSVETYTARRAYQIASDFRRRGVPVVMGGFHATLCPDEVREHCESLVVGEAEELFPELIDDYRHGRPKAEYRSASRPTLTTTPDRSIFRGKRYLPIGSSSSPGMPIQVRLLRHPELLRRHPDPPRRRPRAGEVAAGASLGPDGLLHRRQHRLRPGRRQGAVPRAGAAQARWVSQASITVAFDEEALHLLRESGCQGLLIGFESLDEDNLAEMNKTFNTMRGGARAALENMRRAGLRVYGTFIFGYDHDGPRASRPQSTSARKKGCSSPPSTTSRPFPALRSTTAADEGRLLYDAWWLDERYRYNEVPFSPRSMTPKELERGCLEARRSFYSWRSIWSRSRQKIHRRSAFMWGNFLAINALHHFDIERRSGLPLGDESWQGPFLKAA